MATIKDVAKESGLAVATVSRILNNRGYISEESRQKVSDAMKKLHYQPNEVARSLSKQTNYTIGLIVPHIRHPYFAMLISEIESAASEKGYRILLFNSKSNTAMQTKYVEKCKSNRVAGIILSSATVTEDNLSGIGVPVIAIERFFTTATASVECDNYTGGKLAAEHLAACGCRKALIIGGGSNTKMPADDRTTGFIETFAKSGMSCIEIKTTFDEYNAGDYHERINSLLDQNMASPENIDCIFASSDLIAAQYIQDASERGIRIPQDIKVVGFDDTIIASLMCPSITTIHQPIREIAEKSVELLISAAAGEKVPARVTLPVRLVVRKSTDV